MLYEKWNYERNDKSYYKKGWFYFGDEGRNYGRTLYMFLPVDFGPNPPRGRGLTQPAPQGYCWELLLVRNLWIYEEAGYAILDEIADVLPFRGFYGQCETNYATSIRPSTWGHIKRKGRAD